MKSVRRIQWSSALCAGVVCSLTSLAQGQTVLTIQDSDFEPGNWESGTRVGPFAQAVNASAIQTPSGGNPGAFREMTHSVTNTTSDEFAFGWIWHRYTADTLSLDTREVLSVRYLADHRRIASDGQGTSLSAVVFQNDEIYLASVGVVLGTSWLSFSTVPLTADDFAMLRADGSGTDQTQHPDFSAGAGPLSFGMVFSNTPFGESFSISHGVDNWSVEVTVPSGCSPADLVAPFDILDLADISAFTQGFLTQDAIADLDGNEIWDLADIGAFVTNFLAGCP